MNNLIKVAASAVLFGVALWLCSLAAQHAGLALYTFVRTWQ